MFDNKLLKYSGIVLALLGFLDLVTAAAAYGSVWAMEEPMEPLGILGLREPGMRAALGVLLLAAVVELAGAARGIIGARNTASGAACLGWGIALGVQYAANIAVNLLIEYSFTWSTVILTPIAVGVYIAGALQDRKYLQQESAS